MTRLKGLLCTTALAFITFGAIVNWESFGIGQSQTTHTSNQSVAYRMLDELIVMREKQSGFAGETGTLWTIEPDGHWKAQKFINDNTMRPHAEGQLDADAVNRLHTLLDKANFVALPPSFGDAPPVNPKTITVQVGEVSKTAVFPAGSAAVAGDCVPADSPLCRILVVTAGIKAMTVAE